MKFSTHIKKDRGVTFKLACLGLLRQMIPFTFSFLSTITFHFSSPTPNPNYLVKASNLPF